MASPSAQVSGTAVVAGQQATSLLATVPGEGGGGETVSVSDVGESEASKLEASLLASLQERIKARAAAPEKLKTTGVAFQAVEEVRLKSIVLSPLVPTNEIVCYWLRNPYIPYHTME